MIHQTEQGGHSPHCNTSCLSWTAILAGTLTAIGLGFLLNLFSAAIGLTAYTTQAGNTSLAIGGYIALALSGMVAMFLSGLVSGYLGRSYCSNRNFATLYGFVTWSLALLITIFIASNVAHFIHTQNASLSNASVRIQVTDSSIVLQNKSNAKPETNHSVNISNETKVADILGKSLFLTFILFFIGAISSCLGAYVGMGCCREKCQNK